MQALVLAAGYGTRLGEITLNVAKPLLEIAGRPLISHLVDAIARVSEVNLVAVVTNAKFCDDFEKWAQLEVGKKPIRILNDGTHSNEQRLGAIGDICFAVEQGRLDDDLLIVGGDNLFQFDLCQFTNFAMKRGSCVALFTLPSLELASLYGNVELDPRDRICWFEEKPAQPRTRLIATCIYLIRRCHLSMFESYRQSKSGTDAPGHFIRWLAQRTDVYGYAFDGHWFDIGDMKSLEHARASFAAAH